MSSDEQVLTYIRALAAGQVEVPRAAIDRTKRVLIFQYDEMAIAHIRNLMKILLACPDLDGERSRIFNLAFNERVIPSDDNGDLQC